MAGEIELLTKRTLTGIVGYDGAGLVGRMDASALVGKSLPLNGTIGFIGHSFISMLVSGTQLAYQAGNLVTYTLPFSGNTLFVPLGGVQGVAGNTTTQVLARIAAMVAKHCSAVVVVDGINDIQLTTDDAPTILARMAATNQALLDDGSVVIRATMTPTFGANALTAPQLARWTAVNDGIRAMAAPNVIIVDIAPLCSDASFLNASDGLHPNEKGSYTFGKAIGLAIKARCSNADALSLLNYGTPYVSNLALAGTGGSKDGSATGNVADSYNLYGGGAGGASVVGAKDADGKQLITLSGTVTGNDKLAQFFISVTSAPAVGDEYEAIYRLEIKSALQDIAAIACSSQIQTSGFSNIIDSAVYFGAGSQGTQPIPLSASDGILTIRTPRVQVPAASSPVNITHRLFLQMLNGTSATVAGQFKVHGVGGRKITGLNA